MDKVINMFKKIAGDIVRAALPDRWIRIFRNPVLVPGYYSKIVQQTEKIIDNKSQSDFLDDEYWSSLLRKHAHILDKGLQRNDFEPGHSKVFHKFAVEALDRIKSENSLNDPSVIWAKKKIQEYETIQSEQFKTEHKPIDNKEDSNAYSMLLDIIKNRRSIRIYKDRLIDIQTVNKVIEGANWAPSSCNRPAVSEFMTQKFA
jgi:hypothetical protein